MVIPAGAHSDHRRTETPLESAAGRRSADLSDRKSDSGQPIGKSTPTRGPRRTSRRRYAVQLAAQLPSAAVGPGRAELLMEQHHPVERLCCSLRAIAVLSAVPPSRPQRARSGRYGLSCTGYPCQVQKTAQPTR